MEITERASRGVNPTPAPGQDGDHPTFCRLCEAFCGMVATVRDGKVVRISPDRDNPHSTGHICVKGPAMTAITYDPDRILRPLKRIGKPGEFMEVSWDEALDDIAARLVSIRAAHGANAVSAYLGNPTAFSTDTFMGGQWFLNRIGAKKLYTAGSQDGNSRHLASHILYGITSRRCIPDLPNSDFLLIIGANPLVSHGSFLTAPRIRQDLDTIAARGRVVVIDPRRTETAKRYEHLPIRPNSDCWMLLAMLRFIIDDDLADIAFLRDNVEGWDELKERMAVISLDDVAENTGIALEVIRSLAHDFAIAERAAVYSRTGICRGTFSTLANFLVDAINIAAGKFARPGGSVFGAFPFAGGGALYAGYEVVETRMGAIPVVSGMWPSAIMATDMLQPGPDQIRAMLLVAGNPMLTAPGAETLASAFESLDLFVSCDLYVTESNRYADYILPGTTFLEKADLTVIGASHMPRPFMQYSPPVIPPLGEAWNETEIFAAIAERMGLGPIDPRPGFQPLAAFDEALQEKDRIEENEDARENLSIEALKTMPHGKMLKAGLTYVGWQDYINTPSRKIRLWHPLVVEEFDRFCAETAKPAQASLRLFSQRYLKSLNSWMHNSQSLVRSQTPVLLIHSSDASRRGIASGDQVLISSRNGAVTVMAEVSDDVMPGAVCYPHGWGHQGGWQVSNAQSGININVLLGDGYEVMDPVSGMTFIDGVPVEVSKNSRAIV